MEGGCIDLLPVSSDGVPYKEEFGRGRGYLLTRDEHVKLLIYVK